MFANFPTEEKIRHRNSVYSTRVRSSESIPKKTVEKMVLETYVENAVIVYTHTEHNIVNVCVWISIRFSRRRVFFIRFYYSIFSSAIARVRSTTTLAIYIRIYMYIGITDCCDYRCCDNVVFIRAKNKTNRATRIGLTRFPTFFFRWPYARETCPHMKERDHAYTVRTLAAVRTPNDM